MGHLFFAGGKVGMTAPVAPTEIEEGTVWLFTEDGEFTVPATGSYQIEMHGGGGGAATYVIETSTGVTTTNYNPYGASGGGSGETYTKTLEKGAVIPVTIGKGGTGAEGSYNSIGGTGGTTTFGDLSCTGGGGGNVNDRSPVAGAASGSLATAGGTVQNALQSIIGGYGNINNIDNQTYGDGGEVRASANPVALYALDGQAGAVIVTYLGVA